MSWTHLPVAGGLYDQHPKFLDDILVIGAWKAKVENARKAKENRNRSKGQGASSGSRPTRRGR